MSSNLELLRMGWLCLCPKCQKSKIFNSGITIELKSTCESCGLDFQKNDSADGPAVFLIFILGFSLVPLALLFEVWVSPPLWVHAVLWGFVALVVTLGALRPLKAYVMALQYAHRPGDWK